jgi:hypothetical protein
LLAEFENRNTARQRAIEGMTEDVVESTRLRRIAEDAQRKSEGLLIQATCERRRLEGENFALMEQIKHLSEELCASRAQMEELLHSAQQEQRAAWDERERKYKHIIREMKEHIRKQENVVPVNLYRTAVVEAKQHAKESKNHEELAASLKFKVVELEKVIQAHKFAENEAAQRNNTFERKNQSPSMPKRNHVTFVVEKHQPSLSLAAEADHTVASLSHGAVSSVLAVPIKSPVMRPASVAPTMKPSPTSMNDTVECFITAARAKSPMMKTGSVARTTTPSLENGNSTSKGGLSLNPTTPSNHAPPRTPNLLHKRRTTPPAAGSKTPSRLEFACSPVVHGVNDHFRIRVSMVRAAGGRMGMQKKLREMRSPIPYKQLSKDLGLEKYQKKLEQMHIRPRPLQEKN